MEERRGKKCEKVKAHKKLILSRNKTQETTELIQRNSRDSDNNKTRDLPITVNMMHVTGNRKVRKRKTYTDVVKVKLKHNHWLRKTKAVTLMKRTVRISLILRK